MFRPLTQEEIAQRRELARQRHAERMAADQLATENQKDQVKTGTTAQDDQPSVPSTGNLGSALLSNSGTSVS